MLQEFKKFAMRGSVVDLAIGVIIGAAFGKIIDSMVNDIMMPIIGRSDADAALRAGLASSMLVGIVTSRRIIGVPVLVDADTEKLVATVAPAIQQILVGAPSQTGGIEKGTGA